MSLERYVLQQRIRALELRLTHTQGLLRQVAAKQGLPEDPLEAEVRRMIAHGQELEAIKRVRESRGMTLREAKECVDAL